MEAKRTSGGIGFLGVFFLVLFVLKVTGPLANVSWWWITMPLWVLPALILTILAAVGVIWLAATVVQYVTR